MPYICVHIPYTRFFSDWDTAHMWDIFPDVTVIVLSEILIDWLKHAFVTKFNGIPVETYNDYRVCTDTIPHL